MVRRMKISIVPCATRCTTRTKEFLFCINADTASAKIACPKMFSSSSDTTLTCPRCRHVSVVGNSVQGLRKNFAMLALIDAASGGDNFDYTDDEADAHPEIGEESSGVEMWDAIVAGGGGRCKHRVAVKKMSLREGSLYLLMDRCFGSVQSEMQGNEGRLT